MTPSQKAISANSITSLAEPSNPSMFLKRPSPTIPKASKSTIKTGKYTSISVQLLLLAITLYTHPKKL